MTFTTYTDKDLNSILANKIQSITSEGWVIDTSVDHKCSPSCTFQISFSKPDGGTKLLFVEKTEKTHSIVEEDISQNKSTRSTVSYTKSVNGGYVETLASSASSVGNISFKSFIDDKPHPVHRISEESSDAKKAEETKTPATCPLVEDPCSATLNTETNINTEDTTADNNTYSDSIIPSLRDMIRHRTRPLSWLRRRKHNKEALQNTDALQKTRHSEVKEEKTLSDYINKDTVKNAAKENLYLRRKLNDDLYNDLFDSSLRDIANIHRDIENFFRHVFWL